MTPSLATLSSPRLASLREAQEASEFGGKAAGLAQLVRLGLQVPPGFALHKDARGLPREPGALPPELADELASRLAALSSERVIVRSSAIGEDSTHHSFAGQLDSFVVENRLAAVQAAVLRCWEGLTNERVAAYAAISGRRLAEMGVVIQEFVEADYAGVTFTESPQRAGEVYTEYVQGDNEQLVSGRVTPHGFAVPAGSTAGPATLPFEAGPLLQGCAALRRAAGRHLDIEWLYRDGAFFFVQARPITTRRGERVAWSNTNLNENYPTPISPLLYSIARDAYYHYFKNLTRLLGFDPGAIRALEPDFSNIVGSFGQRLYYNMTSIHNVIAASPLRELLRDAFDRFVGYDERDAASKRPPRRSSLLRLVGRLVRLNLQLEGHVRDIETKVARYAAAGERAETPRELNEQFHAFLELRFHQWYHASLADFFAMLHYKLLGRFTQRFYGEASVGVHNALVQAIPNLISCEPLCETWDLVEHIRAQPAGEARFLSEEPAAIYRRLQGDERWAGTARRVEAYLQRWGFRCSGELMFLQDNYRDDPAKFVELVQSFLRNALEDPRRVIAEKDAARRRAKRSFAAKILRKRHLLWPLAGAEIAWLYLVSGLCERAIASRERVRYRQAQMYSTFKGVTKKIGASFAAAGLLDASGDVFYLDYREIAELLASSHPFGGTLRERVRLRKAEFARESAKRFPPAFETEFGRRPERVQPPAEVPAGAREFRGLAASAGSIRGRVKVLESVLECAKVDRGDILVTRQTDPGWAMVFPLIGGLVVERGGALSHGAIVAREFGIPAVVGVAGVVDALQDGDEVVVDGDRGRVHKV